MRVWLNRWRLVLRYRLLYPLLARLPARIGYRLATAVGRIAVQIDRSEFAAASAALAKVFPAQTAAQRKGILLTQQGLRSREILDIYRLRQLQAHNVERSVRLEGVEHLRQAAAVGRPVVLYSAHFGRLIMPLVALGLAGIRNSCLTADFERPDVPAQRRRYLTFKHEQMQRLMGGEVIQRGAPLRRLYRVLHDKGVLIVILDAPPAAGDSVERFPFLGGTAQVSPGALRLARRTNALLIPYFALERDGLIEGRILPPVDVEGIDDASAMARLFAPIEKQILAHPDHWWMWQILHAIRQPRSALPLKGRIVPVHA